MREKLKPINRATYKFRAQKKKPPKEQRPQERKVKLKPETILRISTYAKRKRTSFSRALETLLNTKESFDLCEKQEINWKERMRELKGVCITKALDWRKRPTK